MKGISDAEIARIVAARPFHSLTDLWQRARPSRPVVERLVMAGALDTLYAIGSPVSIRRRSTVTRRDLLLQVAELDRWSRATDKAIRAASSSQAKSRARIAVSRATHSVDGRVAAAEPRGPAQQATRSLESTGFRGSRDGLPPNPERDLHPARRNLDDPRVLAAMQSQAALPVGPVDAVQLALDLGDTPAITEASGLPEMSGAERVRAELEILGLDVSSHVVEFYAPMLRALGVTWSRDLLTRRSRSELLVAGVKVATQTPPIRSGRRVVFLTLDDGSGPVDATFFEDAQGPYAATLFHSWLLVVRGELRRTGPKGVSLRATGCWELTAMYEAWKHGGVDAVHDLMGTEPLGFAGEQAVQGAAESRSTRPVMAQPPSFADPDAEQDPAAEPAAKAGGMGRRRVLVHASGFKQSPYADIRPPGEDTKQGVPRKLWHSSPGSSGP